jgi:hypothetical protein
MAKYTIGEVSACIAGDYRYTTFVVIEFDPNINQVIIQRKENGAIGGMDGPGGSYGFGITGERHFDVASTPAQQILNAIKSMFDDTITRYGKPSKNFYWQYTGEYGISKKKLENALATMRTICQISV